MTLLGTIMGWRAKYDAAGATPPSVIRFDTAEEGERFAAVVARESPALWRFLSPVYGTEIYGGFVRGVRRWRFAGFTFEWPWP